MMWLLVRLMMLSHDMQQHQWSLECKIEKA